jgi:hypothetical protein
MSYFDLKAHELCGGYIKDILCQVGLSVCKPRKRRRRRGSQFGKAICGFTVFG